MQHEWNLSGLKVHIGIPAYGDLPPKTSASLCSTLLTLVKEGVEFFLSIKTGNCYIDQVRSVIGHEFLSGPADYLFHIDSDMAWEPREFLQVLAHTTVMDAVSVAYLMKDDVERYTVCLPDSPQVNEYGCIPMNGGGLGFTCVKRAVIESLAARAEKVKMGSVAKVPWVYRIRSKEGTYQGEDMAFFEDMRDAGFQPWLDINLTVGHLGRKEFRGSLLKSILDGEDTKLLGWRFPKDVEGWLSEHEAMALARLAHDKSVLEIGSYCGRSTIAMAQTARSVDSIDWHNGDGMSGDGGTLEKFKFNLKKYKLGDRVKIHLGRTQDIAPTLPDKSFDMAFIDGAHDEASFSIDAKESLRLVKPGGAIAVHDMQLPAMQRGTAEFFGKCVGAVDGMAWFQTKA